MAFDVSHPRDGGAPRPARAVTLLVCTRCRQKSEATDPGGHRAGVALLEHVRASVSDPRVSVQPVACMSGCRRACVAGPIAPGRVGSPFGDLPPTTAAGIACADRASRYAASPHGHLRRSERPPLLREGILARLPPLAWANGTEITWPA